MTDALPLKGRLVLDLSQGIAGPACGMAMAEHGARVIKVEPPAGDWIRGLGAAAAPGATAFSLYYNRGKESLTLDLKSEAGRAAALKLAARADLVLSNFKPRVMEKLGLGRAALEAANPGIVQVDSSAFGATGPWSDRMGYGPLVRANAGLSGMWRYPDDPDSFSDALTIYPDHVGARVGAAGALALLIRRLRTGRGGTASVSQTEVMHAHLAAEIARLPTVPTEIVDSVLKEFRDMASAKVNIATGGLEFARAMLEVSLGDEKAYEIMDLLAAQIHEAPFEFLRNTDPRQVLSFISEEHPQTIALVLAHMLPDSAAMVLGSLPEGLQRDVAVRVALMDRTSPEVIERVERTLERKLSSVLSQSDFSEAGGVDALVEILNRADRGTERLILEGLETANSELADEVRQLMFVFEDITTLDDRSVQLILRQVDNKDLAVALKGVPATVKEKIQRNMSERAGAALMEEIDLMGPVRLKDVETAQGSIVRVIRTLEEAGQIVLSRSGDEFVE